MNLSATTIKVDPEKLELVKMKGVNVSQLCREAIDTHLRLSGGTREMLETQLVEIRKQIQILTLEEKIIINQLESMESEEAVNEYREALYFKWRNNLAYMIKHKTIEWKTQKELFRFPDVVSCKKWIIGRLKEEKLI